MPDARTHTIQHEAQPGFQLSEAILLYFQRGTGRAYATQHDMAIQPDGKPVIMAGSPLTQERLLAWAKALDAAPPLTFLEPHILAKTADVTIWWRPAQRRKLYFNLDAKLRTGLTKLNRKAMHVVPCPAHLFAASRSHLYIYALRDDARPTPDTVLLRSPIMNIFEDGALCWGSVQKPRLASQDACAQFEAAVFDGWNTHPNGTQGEIGPHGLVRLWDDLITSKASRFPVDVLPAHTRSLGKTPSDLTLADLISSLRNC